MLLIMPNTRLGWHRCPANIVKYVRHLRSKTVSQAPHPCPHETRWWTRSHSKTLLLLTYRLTWDSSSGSFVGHVWRGWMPKERDDFAFQRRVCASWLPQDPLVSGSISGPEGWDAVLKQKEMGKGLRTGRWQVHLSPVWNLPPRTACLFRSIKGDPQVSSKPASWPLLSCSGAWFWGTAWDQSESQHTLQLWLHYPFIRQKGLPRIWIWSECPWEVDPLKINPHC